VCGEIMAYEDLKEYGSETAVKAAGKLRQQGKPYESMFFVLIFKYVWLNDRWRVVIDGDIAYWKAGG
jgi:obg-like ATPase 1